MVLDDFINLENFIQRQGFFLRLFQDKNLKGRFILNPIIEIVGFSIFNKNEKEHKIVEEPLQSKV